MSGGEGEAGKRKRAAARATPNDEASSAGDKTDRDRVRRVSARAALARAKQAREPRAGVADGSGAGAQARPRGTRVATSRATQPPARAVGNDAPLHDMERDLVGLLHDIEGADGDADARRRAADAIGRIAARLHPEPPVAGASDDGLFGGARHLLSTDYYLKQWGRLGMRGRSERVDDFGLDPTYEARVQPLLDLLYERYFRVQIEGVEHIPAQGAALLVCNHGGTLPWDGVMLKTALRNAHPSPRALRWLTDDFIFHSPFLGAWLNRIGAVRACPENAERLLERQELLAVFPEGVKGIGKPYRERYQLQRFGRGGHIKLALRMRVPLIPVAIVGAEESYPLLHKVRAFSKLLGMPFIPVTPLFPWLGPVGLVPLPSRWQIVVGEPMRDLEALSVRAAEDSVVVNDLNEQLRGRVQTLLRHGLEHRGPNAFF